MAALGGGPHQCPSGTTHRQLSTGSSARPVMLTCITPLMSASKVSKTSKADLAQSTEEGDEVDAAENLCSDFTLRAGDLIQIVQSCRGWLSTSWLNASSVVVCHALTGRSTRHAGVGWWNKLHLQREGYLSGRTAILSFNHPRPRPVVGAKPKVRRGLGCVMSSSLSSSEFGSAGGGGRHRRQGFHWLGLRRPANKHPPTQRWRHIFPISDYRASD